jgi:aminoglycoside phosphotransferase (APT) family kinase protein
MSAKTPGAVLWGTLAWHPAVQAWATIVPGARKPETIEVLRRGGKKAAIYRLMNAAPHEDGRAVIAQRARLSKALIERAIYHDVLPHLPVPAPRFYGFLEDGPEFAWLFLEDVGADRYDPADPTHRALGARWLAQMHATAAGVAATRSLPAAGPARYLRHLRKGRSTIESHLANPAITAEESDELRMIVANLDRTEGAWARIEAVCAPFPKTLVHGDFRRKNVYLRRGPRGVEVLPIDWETAGWGVPAIDLIRIDVATYCDAAQTTWPDLRFDVVSRVAVAGRIFSQLAGIDWVSPQLGYEDHLYIIRPMSWLRDFHAQLGDALRELSGPS